MSMNAGPSQPRCARISGAGAVVLGVLGGCREPAAVPPVGVTVPPLVEASAPAADAPPPRPSAQSTVTAVPGAAPERKGPHELTGPLRVELALRDGAPPCTFVFEALRIYGGEAGYTVMGVRRIAVEESTLCAAATIFDGEAERRVDPDRGALEGGVLAKPGHLFDWPAGGHAEWVGVWVDLDFDGYLDLDVMDVRGNYSSSYRYWVYDPKQRRMLPNTRLRQLISPQFDAAKKVITAGGRISGPLYVSGVYAWIRGKLEPLEETTSYLGQDPNGQRLPAGYSSYEIRHARVNDVLHKVFDGPMR
ncbi:MAG: hypothetical protein IT373_25510 [Polyangiaceae bacterium]|nr:hypothetical protein [Polyangiaceae bacterium]